MILDYIYHGEVNLFQEQLDSFLESAQKLEVEGLLAGNNDFEEKTQNLLESETLSKDLYQQPDEEKQVVHSDLKITSKIKRESVRTMSNVDENKLDVGSMTPEEIEIRTSSIYEKKDGGWNCLECGYSTTINSSTMRRHVETHFKGLSYTCKSCNKEFRSKHSLSNHKSIYHKFV